MRAIAVHVNAAYLQIKIKKFIVQPYDNLTMNDSFIKINDFRGIKLKQAIFEISSIKRAIDFIMEENIHLKNRIAEILEYGFNNKMLVKLEIFQNSFISQDQLIGLLRNEVAQIEQKIHREAFSKDETMAELCSKLKKLQQSMEATENQFIKLKASFNDFLLL